jgi:hypothetical protein
MLVGVPLCWSARAAGAACAPRRSVVLAGEAAIQATVY